MIDCITDLKNIENHFTGFEQKMEQPLYNMILYFVICVNVRCMFVLKNNK